MLVQMPGLVLRKSVYVYRRAVPPRLRSIVAKREWKISLGMGDLAVAQRRLSKISAEVEREIKEAEAGTESRSVGLSSRSALETGQRAESP